MWSPFPPLISKHVILSSAFWDDSVCTMWLLNPSYSISGAPEQCWITWHHWVETRTGWRLGQEGVMDTLLDSRATYPRRLLRTRPAHQSPLWEERGGKRTRCWTIVQSQWTLCSTDMSKLALDSSFLWVDLFLRGKSSDCFWASLPLFFILTKSYVMAFLPSSQLCYFEHLWLPKKKKKPSQDCD